ncbi:MAG: phosphoribosylformylglycinamidine synthase subunit PurS, partial [Syntrophaceae bacterium]|nr:phosphoribosylformylglycinamidine synthase subunit PurS [Syntrophaceae bacterium]
MVHRIEIGFKEGIRDVLGERIKRKIIEHLDIAVEEVKTIDVYTIEGEIDRSTLETIAGGPLSDAVIQRYKIDVGLAENFDWLIEVGFRPGVTDNVGKTAKEAVRLLVEESERQRIGVYTSRQYVIKGKLERDGVEKLASRLLANELIQRYEIVSGSEWDPGKGVQPYVPRVIIEDNPTTDQIDLDIGDEGLQKISSKRVLALTIDEMKVIKNYLKNESVVRARKKVGLSGRITDVELESLAQTWSE